MEIVKIIIFLPGYIMLAFIYFFPTEWGKNKSTTKGARMWQYKSYFAPIISLLFYALLVLFLMVVRPKIAAITEAVEVQQSTAASAPETSPMKLDTEIKSGVMGGKTETKNSTATVTITVDEETASENPKPPTEVNSLVESEEPDKPTSSQSKIDAKSMWELEEAVQYHGHNPEIRKRLGLPPKEIGPKK